MSCFWLVPSQSIAQISSDSEAAIRSDEVDPAAEQRTRAAEFLNDVVGELVGDVDRARLRRAIPHNAAP